MLFNQPTLTVHAMGRLKNIPDLLSADVMSFFTGPILCTKKR